MAHRRNLSVTTNSRNVNRRSNVQDNSMMLNSVHSAISEFLRSKNKEFRRLINDPTKVSFVRSIKQAQDKLIEEVTDYRGLISLQVRSKIFRLLYRFQSKVNFLLSSDSRVKSNNEFNYNLFDTAVTTGCINIIRNFLNSDFNVNSIYDTQSDQHCIALHRAAQSQQVEIAEFLVQHGADVNITNFHGKNALFYAAQAGDWRIIKLLLNNNAQINDPDILTAGILSKSVEMIKLLIEYGANVNQKDLCGRVPLHFVSGSKKGQNLQLRSGFEGSIRAEMAKILIQYGAHVDSKTTSGITPLHAAAIKGYSQVVETLLINGAAANMPVFDNKTAIFYASHNAYPEVVNVLLKYGADINVLDERRKSALNMAYYAGRTRYAMVCNKLEPYVNIKMKYIYLLDNMEVYEPDFSDYDHYDDSVFPYYRERTIDLIEKHVIKMVTAGIFVREEIKSHINAHSKALFQKSYEEELENMKKVLLVNCLTGFDLMKMDLNVLAAYTRNPDIRDILQRYNYPKKFPLYGNIIDTRIRAAIQREATLTEGCDMLAAVLCLPGSATWLPFNCTEHIVKYLDNDSISRMVRAFGGLKTE